MRSTAVNRGDFQAVGSPQPRRRWRVEGEIRAPATLVDATSYAIADPGSIPGVSTEFTKCRPLLARDGLGFALSASWAFRAACIDQGESSRSERSRARELSVVPQSSAPLAAAAQRLLRCLPGIARRRQQALLIALLSGARAPGGAWGSGLRPGRSPRQDGRRRVPLSPSHCVRRLWRRRSRRRGAGRSVPLRRRSALHPRSEVHDRRNLRPADRRLRNRRRTLRAGEPRGNHRRGRRPGGRSSRGALRPGLLQLPPAWPWRATAPSWSQKPIGTASARSARPGRPPPRSTASRHLRGSAPRAMGQCSSPTRKPIAWFASSADGRFAQARGDHRHLGWERRRVCASHGVAADGAGLLGGGRSLQQPRPALRRRRDHSTARRCLTGNRGRVLGPAAETAFGNPRRYVQALDLESFWLRTRAKPDTRRPCPTVQALHASAGPRLPSTRRCGELPRPACFSRPLAGRDDPPAHGAAHLEVPLPRHPSRPGPAPPPATHLGALLGNQRLVPRSAHPVRVRVGRGG